MVNRLWLLSTAYNLGAFVVYFDQRLGAAHIFIFTVIFSVFCAKNLKKQELCTKTQQKTGFFLHFTKTLVDCFTPKNELFSIFPYETFLLPRALKQSDRK